MQIKWDLRKGMEELIPRFLHFKKRFIGLKVFFFFFFFFSGGDVLLHFIKIPNAIFSSNSWGEWEKIKWVVKVTLDGPWGG
jgi:hypothetical protein